MPAHTTGSGRKKSALPVWWIILFTAPAPVLLFVVFFVKWYQLKTDFGRFKTHFLSRQNAVLAFNAVNVAGNFSALLEKAEQDLRALSLLPEEDGVRRKFVAGQLVRTPNAEPAGSQVPFYNRFVVLDGSRKKLSLWQPGDTTPKAVPLETCDKRDLCDRETMEAVLKEPLGTVRYGRVLRYYVPKDHADDPANASLLVIRRTLKGAVGVGIDYRHLRSYLATPTFPYDSKRDLLQAYDRGNYIFVVDRETNIIAHPRYWHQAGIDRETGEWRLPLETDDEAGKKPIRVDKYRGEMLREYFRRLLERSFRSSAIDLFLAPNLAGVRRVVSIAPVTIAPKMKGPGDTTDDGVFGWTIVGCSVDYFEEPKERILPYY